MCLLDTSVFVKVNWLFQINCILLMVFPTYNKSAVLNHNTCWYKIATSALAVKTVVPHWIFIFKTAWEYIQAGFMTELSLACHSVFLLLQVLLLISWVVYIAGNSSRSKKSKKKKQQKLCCRREVLPFKSWLVQESWAQCFAINDILKFGKVGSLLSGDQSFLKVKDRFIFWTKHLCITESL